MNKFLLIVSLVALSTPLTQAKEKVKEPLDEGRSAGSKLYQPLPQTDIDASSQGVPNRARSRVLVTNPTQYYYTKSGVISYRYSQSWERADGILEGYMGPRSAAFTHNADFNFMTMGASIRSYANVSSRSQQGVAMVPQAEAPAKSVEKTQKSAKTGLTTIQLAQQR